MALTLRATCAALLLAATFWLDPAGASAAPAAQLPTAADCDRILLTTQLAGRTVDAAEQLDQALASLRTASSPVPDALGRCALYTAMLYQGAGDYTTAIEAYTIARDAFQTLDDVQLLWTARYGRASILMAQGHADEALAELAEAQSLLRRDVCWIPQDIKPVAEAVTLNNIGINLAIKGDLDLADTQVVAAAQMLDDLAAQAATSDDIAFASLLAWLSSNNQTNDSDPTVADQIQKLLSGGQADNWGPGVDDLLRQIRATGPGLPEAGSVPLEDVGAALQGLLGLTSSPCSGASGIGGVVTAALLGGQVGPQLARVLSPVVQSNRGEIARLRGDLDSAEALLGEALHELTVGAGTGGLFTATPSSVLAAATEMNLGMVAYDRDDYVAALEHFKGAESRLRSLGQRRNLPVVLTQIGYLEQLRGDQSSASARYAEAMDLLDEIQAADDGGAQASISVGMLDANATTLAGSLSPFADVYNLAAGLALVTGDTPNAFAITERGRARLFLDMVRAATLRADNPATAALLDRERRAAFLLAAMRNQEAQIAAIQPPQPWLVRNTDEQLAKAERNHEVLLDELRRAEPGFAGLITAAEDTLSLKQTQELLDTETTLLAYYQFDPRTPELSGSVAFIITSSDVQVVRLPGATAATINAALQQLGRWPSLRDLHPRPLLDLYASLVADLPITTPLIGIVPHQSLHKVPFAALSDGESYLGGRHKLFQLPSASILPVIRTNGGGIAQPPRAVILGNPDAASAGLLPLPAAGEEAVAVAAALGQAKQTRREASEALLRAEAPNAAVIHLAAHGVYSPTSPLASAIYLSPGGGEDGALSAGEVLTLDLRQSALVVLSACDTNLGQLSAGDELVGLTRAFFVAGTPAVISSLWQVNDVATSAFMTAFYQAWQRDGLGRAEALQAAQEALRRSDLYASPFYWAAFSLSGDPGVGPALFDLPEPTQPPQPPTSQPATSRPQLAALAASPASTAMPRADESVTPTASAGSASGTLCGLALVLPVGAIAILWRRTWRRRR